MNHPLTDEILQQISEDPLDGVVGGTFVKEYMRAAYDLGFREAALKISIDLMSGMSEDK